VMIWGSKRHNMQKVARHEARTGGRVRVPEGNCRCLGAAAGRRVVRDDGLGWSMCCCPMRPVRTAARTACTRVNTTAKHLTPTCGGMCAAHCMSTQQPGFRATSWRTSLWLSTLEPSSTTTGATRTCIAAASNGKNSTMQHTSAVLLACTI
jgi:hypothetical protein